MEAMLSDTSPPKESKELSDLDGREDELSGGFVSSEEEEVTMKKQQLLVMLVVKMAETVERWRRSWNR